MKNEEPRTSSTRLRRSLFPFQPFRVSEFSHLFYTGPIDAFFGFSEGRLGCRTVTFDRIETETEDY